MNQTFTIYSIFFLAASMLSFFLVFLAWQRKTVKGARDLLHLMVSTGFWTLFTMVETAMSSPEEKIFWAKLGYTGAVTAPVLYLIFVFRFTGQERLLSMRNVSLLFLVPLITLIICFTNENHHLLWSGFSPIDGNTNIMQYYHGPWFWVGYMGYNYLVLLAATIFLFGFIFQRAKALRKQAWLIFAASLSPWSASIIYLSGLNPVPGLDLVPVSILLSGLFLTYAIFNLRFLDLAPVARDAMVESMKDGILALDGQNRIQDINQSALSILGLSGGKVIGSPIEMTSAALSPLFAPIISPAMPEFLDITVGNPARSYHITHQNLKGQPGSRLIVISDITDQVASQEKIVAGEEKYREMFTMFRLLADNMSEMLWAKDLNKQFIFANKSICDNLLNAANTDEPIGKTDIFFALRERQRHPDDAGWHTFGELCQDSDQVVINSGKPERFDEYGNVKGKFLFLDVRKAPIFDKEGQMIGVVGSARDVTQQREAENEIIRRDHLLVAIAKATAVLVQGDHIEQSINQALELIGKATNVNRVYIFQNHTNEGYQWPLFSQRYEWTDGTVEPQLDNPELQDVPYEVAAPRWYETLLAGEVVVGNIRDFPESEKEALEPQGIKSILVTPVFIDKKFWGFIGFDACFYEKEWLPTEKLILSAAANTIGAAYLRKINQNELVRAKEKAEESDRLKSAFLANISHEIRTPMNGILGFLSLLEEPDLDEETKTQYVGIVNKSGERLLNTINDIIEISKLEAGQSDLVCTHVNIVEALQFQKDFFSQQADRKGLSLRFSEKVVGEEAWILTDFHKLSGILTNLISNAIKFTQQGSIEVGNYFDEDSIVFYVRDTGKGIPADRLGVIFERFMQAEPGLSRVHEGSGLGLSIAQAYVSTLGGKIWVESEQGKGSTFYFSLPRNR